MPLSIKEVHLEQHRFNSLLWQGKENLLVLMVQRTALFPGDPHLGFPLQS